jgi:4-hydroxybenzoate polyprenyltransferase
VRIVHPFPSLLVAVVTAAITCLASPHDHALAAQLGFGMLFFQFSIGVTNDIVDAEVDRAGKPWKPLARGVIGRRTAVLLAAGCAGAGLLITASLPTGAWLIGALGLACGLAYDVYLKRTVLSWLPYAIAFPLIPVWAYVAADAWQAVLWWVFPFGAALGLALQLANQVPDIAADRAAGVRGAPQRLGVSRSSGIAVALFGIVASGVVLVLLGRSTPHALFAAVDGASVALLAPRAPVFFGRDGLFGLLAAGSAVLTVVFLLAV